MLIVLPISLVCGPRQAEVKHRENSVRSSGVSRKEAVLVGLPLAVRNIMTTQQLGEERIFHMSYYSHVIVITE